jgi:large subunit ribosomal protein L10
MVVRKKNHFKEWKNQHLKEIEELLKNNDMVAVADISGLPASAMLHFRKVLKENNFKVKVVKLRLLQKALDKMKIKDLKEKYVKESVALIVGNDNPFKLYRLIKKNASDASAKEGIVAPTDLVVKAGDTNIPPGPALSDFKVVNIKTQIRKTHNSLTLGYLFRIFVNYSLI